MPNLADLRENYTRGSLDPTDILPDPLAQFQRWLEQALAARLPEPNAMHLTTVGTDGRPSGRIVLLKGLDDGFLFFTNYQSRKGHELAHNDHAALTFFWVELERQVRVEGCVERVSEAESDAYFASRPRGSQIGAWVSAQSEVVSDRDVLETKHAELEARFAGKPVPRPPHWGGYRLKPDYMEFWQGRPSRLHDRIAYTKQPGEAWKIERLSP